MIKGQLSHELEVSMPAAMVWETYGTLQLDKLLVKLLPNVVRDLQVMEGNGGVGTLVSLTWFHPDTPGFSVYKTKLTKIDNENRVREEELVEGEYLDVGFLLYRVRFEILEKDDDLSIIRSTIEYELAEECVMYASLVSINSLAIIAEVAGKHLTEEYKAKLKA
ncbi:hypothetical protein MRB53_019336 [Persea americana]|uniref:Uncharacterized protein n=1 Tax=Persea americana TaxID=3435 RepID=A0ACC2KXS9_PERAE|nr:hypothetical protein MRB53_019336 [Persea americana]